MLARRDYARKIEDEAERKVAIKELIDNNQLTQRRLYLGKTLLHQPVLEKPGNIEKIMIKTL